MIPGGRKANQLAQIRSTIEAKYFPRKQSINLKSFQVFNSKFILSYKKNSHKNPIDSFLHKQASHERNF